MSNSESCSLLTSISWKAGLHKGLTRLERITGGILDKLNLPEISAYDENGYPPVGSENSISLAYSGQTVHSCAMSIPLSFNQPANMQQEQQARQIQQSLSPQDHRLSPQDHRNLPHSPISFHRDEPSVNGQQTDDDVIIAEPMGSLYEVTKLNKFRRRDPQDERDSTQGNEILDDFIARGTIDLAEAEELLMM